MRGQAERFGADIMQGNVVSVDLRQRPFVVRTTEAEYHARAVIVATGASARMIGLPAERSLLGHGVSTCATCDGFFFRNKPIAVVGGGDSALEEAIFLTKFASKVTVIHRRNVLRASKIMQDKAFANPKIEFRWNAVVEDVKDADKGHVTGLVLRDTVTGEKSELAVEGLFVAIGHTPNTKLFVNQLDDGRQRLPGHPLGDEDQHPGRLRVRRRPGPHLPPGHHGGRLRLHGGDRRGTIPGFHTGGEHHGQDARDRNWAGVEVREHRT